MTEPAPKPAREIEDLSDGTLILLQMDAQLNGQWGFADAVGNVLDARGDPELFRHSRRRKR